MSDGSLEAIFHRLRTIEQSVDRLREVPLRLERIEARLDHTLPNDLRVRLDRLERAERRRVWLALSALGAAITAIVGWIVESLVRR